MCTCVSLSTNLRACRSLCYNANVPIVSIFINSNIFGLLVLFVMCTCVSLNANLGACRSLCYNALIPIVSISIDINSLCLLVFTIVITSVSHNAFARASGSSSNCTLVPIMSVFINRNNLCVSITAFASECLKTFSCTCSGSSYGFCVVMSMRSNVFEGYLVSSNGVSNKVFTVFGNYHIVGIIVRVPRISDAVEDLKLIVFLKINSDSPGSLIFRFGKKIFFLSGPTIDSTHKVHLMSNTGIVCLVHSSVSCIIYPVNLVCIINKVACLVAFATIAVVEDNLQTCCGFNYHRVRPPAVVKLSSWISGPSVCLIALAINPRVGVNGSPVISVLEVNSYLTNGLVLFFTTSASSCVLDSGLCLFIYFPFTVLVTGSSCFAVNIFIVTSGAGMSCITALCASGFSYNGFVLVSKCVNARICIIISAMTGVSGVTLLCTSRICNFSFVLVSCSRDCFRSLDYVTTNRAVYLFCHTGLGTSRIYLRLSFFCVNCAKALFTNLAVTCAVILVTCCRNGLCLGVICIIITSVCLFTFGLASGSSSNFALVPIVTDSRDIFCVGMSCIMLTSVSLNALILASSRSSYFGLVRVAERCNLVSNVRVAARTSIGCITSLCTSRCSYGCCVFALVLYINTPSTIIPRTWSNSVTYVIIGRNYKVVCLVPHVIPAVSSSSGIHTAEDQTGISMRKLCSVNSGSANLCHINPSFTITEEVNCESSVVNVPVIVRNKINNDGLGRLIISNSFFKSLITL